MADYTPAIITASVALIAAVGAQFISHRLTAKREKSKEYKTIYQEFISPTLNDVLFYFSTETDWRKGHDVERTINSEKVIEHMSEKISYGDSNLINALYNYTSSITFFDGRGEAKNIRTLIAFYWYLNYAHDVISHLNNPNKELLDRIAYTQKMYALWTILTDTLDFNTSTRILSWKWAWEHKEFLNSWSDKALAQILDMEEGHIYLKKKLLDNMKNEMIKTQKTPLPQDILDFYDENTINNT
ncbi:hypothetical protein [Neobacillus niacini]|uniref:hypothetical protein n=1 Tax=Neobacillus niacini TaxID=86668 RepID=UPI00285AFC3C|nr:hypothetical protein [Neobacillus niacini]MDR7003083.1 hypothetical protein [Neobacillus niacini]